MALLLLNLRELFLLAVWALMWALGGIWLVRAAFNLRPNEQTLSGVGLGLVLQTWMANLLGQVLPVPLAFWLSAVLVFIAGLGFSLPLKGREWLSLVRIPMRPLQWVALALLAYMFIVVGRGLAVLDDYQNLPITSLLAAGDIPPHFALDPSVQFNYHYFTLISAAQIMRLGGMHAWNSLDIVRGFGFALALIMGALWIQRVTKSTLAGLLGGLMSAFAGGTRWLMLLLPEGVLKAISPHIKMIGSGAQTAPDLFTAITAPWAVDSGAAWNIPFAFTNGINTPSIWTYHAGTGGVGDIIGAFLILAHNRMKGWRGVVVMSALVAALALSSEVGYGFLLLGFGIVALFAGIRQHAWPWRLPASLLRWMAVLGTSGVFALFQGGVLTGVAEGWLNRLTGSAGTQSSYFNLSLAPVWPPAFLSSHLGLLSLFNPAQLLVALFEIGPIIILLPLPLIWGWKALRAGRWYEAALIVVPVVMLVTLLVQYTGSAGPTALTRVQGGIVGLSRSGFAVAALWMLGRRVKESTKALLGTLVVVTLFGGFALFSSELLAAPKPLFSTYITYVDLRAEKDYWNRLEPGALIFDPTPSRAVTIFARPTRSHNTWYEPKPEWEALVENPDPVALRAYGFDYMYFDYAWWSMLPTDKQNMLIQPCVQLVKQYDWENGVYDFRRLLDIRACGP